MKIGIIDAGNNIYADHLHDYGRSPGTPGRIALLVAGDDSGAKAVVMQLIDELGRGASSLVPRSEPPTTTLTACAGPCRRPIRSGRRSGAPRRTAPAASATRDDVPKAEGTRGPGW
jgi:hypothetical protein